MEGPDNALFAIEVNPEDYAEAAAADTQPVSRTHQTEAQFAVVKASYQARQDTGNHYTELLRKVPLLDSPGEPDASDCDTPGNAKPKLGKREQLLLGYTVGELYYDGEFARITDLCEKVKKAFETDKKLAANLEKWSKRAGERVATEETEKH